MAVAQNGVVSVRLSCADPDFGPGSTAPVPLSLGSEAIEIASPPAHGNSGTLSDDRTVFYTPGVNFTGTDSFTYTGGDGTSNSRPATITIDVARVAGTDADTTRPVLTGFKVSPNG